MDNSHSPKQRSSTFKRILPGRLASGLCLIAIMSACSRISSDDTSQHAGHVYVDSRTGEVFQSSRDLSVPATHPQTGKQTLVPGVYCSQCNKWYPQPPPEVLEQFPNSRRCSKDRTLLSLDGPVSPDVQKLAVPE